MSSSSAEFPKNKSISTPRPLWKSLLYAWLFQVTILWIFDNYIVSMRSVISGSMEGTLPTGVVVGNILPAGGCCRGSAVTLLPGFTPKWLHLPDQFTMGDILKNLKSGCIVFFTLPTRDPASDPKGTLYKKEEQKQMNGEEDFRKGQNTVKRVKGTPGDKLVFHRDGSFSKQEAIDIEKGKEILYNDWKRYGNVALGYSPYFIQIRTDKNREKSLRQKYKERTLFALDKEQINATELKDDKSSYFMIALTTEEASKYKQDSYEKENGIKNIYRYLPEQHGSSHRIDHFLKKAHASYRESSKEYPYIVPYKGFQVQLMDENGNPNHRILDAYAKTIAQHDTPGEKATIKLNEQDQPMALYLNNSEKPLSSYTFRYNYVYLAGDNIPDSSDSRVFGPLPIQRISAILDEKKAYLLWCFKFPKISIYLGLMLFNIDLKKPLFQRIPKQNYLDLSEEDALDTPVEEINHNQEEEENS